MTCNEMVRRAIALASFAGAVVAFAFSIEFGLKDASSLAFVGLVLLTVYLSATSIIWGCYSEFCDAFCECLTFAIVLGLILSIYDGVEKRKKETAYDGIMQPSQARSEIQIALSSVALTGIVIARSFMWCCCGCRTSDKVVPDECTTPPV